MTPKIRHLLDAILSVGVVYATMQLLYKSLRGLGLHLSSQALFQHFIWWIPAILLLTFVYQLLDMLFSRQHSHSGKAPVDDITKQLHKLKNSVKKR